MVDFGQLASVDVSKHVEKKNGLNYLSWCWAWSEIVRKYPDARYEIQMFDGKPYLEDPDLGYMVMTKMVNRLINGLVHMQLRVLTVISEVVI